MRKDFGPQSWLYPMPVLIIGTYDADGVPNAMNAAWGGIWDENKVMICLASHKTTDNIQLHKAFTVSFGTASTVVPCDYVGIESANKVPDKFARAGFHTEEAAHVHAPVIQELPMTLECRLEKFVDGCVCVGEIVNISADESILNADGSIDAALLNPICYDPVSHDYRVLGASVGKAFSDGAALKG